jgi:hypothetical protein
VRVPARIASCGQAIVWAILPGGAYGYDPDGGIAELIEDTLRNREIRFTHSFSMGENETRLELLYEMIDTSKVDLHAILQIQNPIFQDKLLRDLGYGQLFRERRGRVLDTDGSMELRRFSSIAEDIRILKVIDTTTGEPHFLRVPPGTRNCKLAVAWTFGLSEQEYAPVAES